jgi:nucleoside-diphosphate-sugar epimerase
LTVLSNKTVGIVGGSGYLGCHLARALSVSNLVRVIDVKMPDYLSASSNLSFVH